MRRRKYTLTEVQEYIKLLEGKCLSESYQNNKTKMIFQCNKDNHIWTSTFKDIKNQGNWCPKCAGNINLRIADAHKIAKERNGQCLSENYQNNKIPLDWSCNICLKKWKARLDRIKNGTWCPHCRKSHGERIISEYLDTLGIKYQTEILLKDCGFQRLDFYIKKENLAIEFDGVQHFQIYRRYAPDKKTFEKIRQLDIKKTIYCIEKGIRLLRICYDTKKIHDVVNYALQTKIPIILAGWKYIELSDSIPFEEFELLTGVGKQ